jgi:hypothetical protein
MKRRTEVMGLAALSMLLLAACGPDAGERTDLDAEAAEAPPVERPIATPFQNWDLDQNQKLERQEFGIWVTEEEGFGDWFGDEGLNREALRESAHSAWDVNDDGVVNEAEWQVGVAELYGDADYGTWTDWDLDGNAELDLSETAEAETRYGFYDRIDINQDMVIDQEELGDFFFDLFDTNDDSGLDVTEWDGVRADWLDDGMM